MCLCKINANIKVIFQHSQSEGMSKKKNPLVYLDVSVDGGPVGRIVIEVTCYWKSSYSSILFCKYLFYFSVYDLKYILLLESLGEKSLMKAKLVCFSGSLVTYVYTCTDTSSLF